MRKFGLVGGTSWLSTIEYYRGVNTIVNQRFGSNINPPLYLANLNQKAISELQKNGDWDAIASILIEKCRELASVGCEGIAFCANTPHRVHEAVQKEVEVEILHIALSIGRFVKRKNYNKIGLLGTQYTMEGDFIKGKLKDHFSIDTLVPKKLARTNIQTFLHDEISHGVFSEEAQAYFSSLIEKFKFEAAEAVLLGCTEFPILLNDINVSLPKIDSVECHVEDIARFILES